MSTQGFDLLHDLAAQALGHAAAVEAVDLARADEARHAERFDDLLERLRPALRNVAEQTVFYVDGAVLVWDGDTLNVGRVGTHHDLKFPEPDVRPPVAESVTDLDDAA